MISGIKLSYVLQQEFDDFLDLAAEPEESTHNIFLRYVGNISGLFKYSSHFLKLSPTFTLLQLQLIDSHLQQFDLLLCHKLTSGSSSSFGVEGGVENIEILLFQFMLFLDILDTVL